MFQFKMNQEEETDGCCDVCSATTDQRRVHYGGVSCLSCRQFFRRSALKSRVKSCKFQGNCNVSYKESPRICINCRYQKCLR